MHSKPAVMQIFSILSKLHVCLFLDRIVLYFTSKNERMNEKHFNFAQWDYFLDNLAHLHTQILITEMQKSYFCDLHLVKNYYLNCKFTYIVLVFVSFNEPLISNY